VHQETHGLVAGHSYQVKQDAQGHSKNRSPAWSPTGLSRQLCLLVCCCWLPDRLGRPFPGRAHSLPHAHGARSPGLRALLRLAAPRAIARRSVSCELMCRRSPRAFCCSGHPVKFLHRRDLMLEPLLKQGSRPSMKQNEEAGDTG
jgi:hypothetical protein